MPVILAPADYERRLGKEPDPRDLMRPYPAEPMRMWPISTRVNKPENDDPSIVEPTELVHNLISVRQVIRFAALCLSRSGKAQRESLWFGPLEGEAPKNGR
jgi:isoleucyl-tRNA synthetase